MFAEVDFVTQRLLTQSVNQPFLSLQALCGVEEFVGFLYC